MRKATRRLIFRFSSSTPVSDAFPTLLRPTPSLSIFLNGEITLRIHPVYGALKCLSKLMLTVCEMKPFLVGFSVACSLPLWELRWHSCGLGQGDVAKFSASPDDCRFWNRVVMSVSVSRV